MGGAERGVLGGGTHLELIHVGLAEYHHPRLPQPPGDGRVIRGTPAVGVVAVQVFTLFEDPSQCGGASRCALSFTSDQLRALEWIYRRREQLKVAAINMS